MNIESHPIISVIVCTHNSESVIKSCILSIKSQSFPREKFEIIIVDDGSKDKTIEIVTAENVDKIIKTEPCSIGEARNIGVKHTSGKFIAFTDSDCVVKEDWLDIIVNELENNKAISGSILNGNTNSLVAWAEYFMEFSEFNEHKKRSTISFAPGCNQAYTKETILSSGGFTKKRLSDDVIFGKSLKDAGVNIIFVPELQIEHLCRMELKKQLANSRLLGRYCYRNTKYVSTIWKKLTKNRCLIPIIFIVKIGARTKRAFLAKKFFTFLKAFPIIVLSTTAFCDGILQEMNSVDS